MITARRWRRAVLVVALALAGAAGVAPATAGAAGATHPGPVRRVQAHAVSSALITLTWQNPAGTDFAGTLVRFAPGAHAPTSPTAGARAGRVPAGRHSLTVGGLQPGAAYSFALFAAYPHGRYAQAATAHESTGPAGVAHLHALLTNDTVELLWTNPTTPSFRAVVVRIRAGRDAPQSPTDGRAVHLASATARSVHLLGLAVDTHYSVSVFTRDAALRWSRAVTTSFTTEEGAASTQAVVEGRVTDAAKHPLAGVRVSAVNFLGNAVYATAPTGADGRYRITVPAGDVELDVDGSHATGGDADASGYALAGRFLTLAGGQTVQRDVVLRAGGVVAGQVTDVSGRPLGGVRAYLQVVPGYVSVDSFNGFFVSFGLSGPALSASTRSDGTFVLGGVPAGGYLLCFDTAARITGGSADNVGYQARCQQDSVVIRPREHEQTPAIALPSAALGAVSGVVLAADRHPLVGAAIEVELVGSEDESGFTETGADGSYQVAGLAAGAYRLCAAAESGAPDRSPTGSAPRCVGPITVVSGRTSTATIALPRGAAVTGRLTAAGGYPVKNAGVIIEGNESIDFGGGFAETDASGHWRVIGLPTGSYVACFDTESVGGPNLPTGLLRGCYDHETRFHIEAGTIRTGIDARLKKAGGFSGTLLDSAGHPIAYAEVFAEGVHSGQYGTGITDRHGRYVVRSLKAGAYRVCAASFELGTDGQEACRRKPITVPAGKLLTGVGLGLVAGGAVTVHVRDADGDPVGGVDSVLLRPCSGDCGVQPVFSATTRVSTSASWTTDADGTVRFFGLSPGQYAVCAFAYHAATATDTSPTGYADGCSSSTFAVTVTAGATTSVTQTLAPGGLVTGIVTDDAGHPLSDAIVSLPGSPADDVGDDVFFLDDETSPINANTTGADGTFRIKGVRPGTPKLCVDPHGAHAVDPAVDNAGGYLYKCQTSSITVTAAATTTAPPLRVSRAAAISGTVTGPRGGTLRGVFAIAITRSGRGVGFESTGPDGRYFIGDLPANTYKVCFIRPGFESQCFRGVQWPGERRGTAPPLRAATPVVLTTGAVATGVDAMLADD